MGKLIAITITCLAAVALILWASEPTSTQFAEKHSQVPNNIQAGFPGGFNNIQGVAGANAAGGCCPGFLPPVGGYYDASYNNYLSGAYGQAYAQQGVAGYAQQGMTGYAHYAYPAGYLQAVRVPIQATGITGITTSTHSGPVITTGAVQQSGITPVAPSASSSTVTTVSGSAPVASGQTVVSGPGNGEITTTYRDVRVSGPSGSGISVSSSGIPSGNIITGSHSVNQFGSGLHGVNSGIIQNQYQTHGVSGIHGLQGIHNLHGIHNVYGIPVSGSSGISVTGASGSGATVSGASGSSFNEGGSGTLSGRPSGFGIHHGIHGVYGGAIVGSPRVIGQAQAVGQGQIVAGTGVIQTVGPVRAAGQAQVIGAPIPIVQTGVRAVGAGVSGAGVSGASAGVSGASGSFSGASGGSSEGGSGSFEGGSGSSQSGGSWSFGPFSAQGHFGGFGGYSGGSSGSSGSIENVWTNSTVHNTFFHPYPYRNSTNSTKDDKDDD